MKILYLTLGFLPATSWGGPVNVIYQNSIELINRGHEVTVYCSNLLNKNEHISQGLLERNYEGIKVVYFSTLNIPFWPGTIGPYWFLGLISRLRNEIKNFDIVHLHGYRSFINIPAIYFAKKLNKPIIVQPHGGIPVIVNTFFLKKFYDKVLGWYEKNNLDILIALQKSEKNQATNVGIDPEKIKIIPNGLNSLVIPRYPEVTKNVIKEKYNIPSDVPIILFMARINKKKGTDMLIEAFRLIEPDLNSHLVVAGPDDGQLNEVQSLVTKYKLKNKITFTGLLSQEQTIEMYQIADLFVLPCRTDTYPTTIMESCFYDVPIVVTEGCEMSDLINGEVAQVTKFDPDLFAKAINKMLTDPNLYLTYKNRCRGFAEEKFSIESTIDKLEYLYENLLKQND